MKTIYKVTIVTAKAGCESTTRLAIQLELVGGNGKSGGYYAVENIFEANTFKDKRDVYDITCDDVGLPIIIRFKLLNWCETDEWLCDFVTVEYNGQLAEFPIYDWIESNVEATRGEASIPQNVTNNQVKKLRLQEVAKNRSKFAWAPVPKPIDIGWGFPRHVNASTYQQLPKIFQRDEIRANHFVGSGFEIDLNSVFQDIGKTAKSINKLEDYEALYASLPPKGEKQPNLQDWYTDKAFVQHVLNGVSPLCFKRCNAIPPTARITNMDVALILDDHTTIEGEIRAGKIFIADFHETLKGVPRVKHYATGNPLHCQDCIGLFYVNNSRRCVPLAIQLVPGSRDHVFTPNDRKEDWLLAKMYFRCAQSNMHQWIENLLNTHLVLEPFAVSVFRCLPRSHPVFKLLHPFLRMVPAKNTDVRTSLLPPNALSSQGISISAAHLARKAYRTFKLSDLNIPLQLRKNGTDDPNFLPNYQYRNDVVGHWKIMEKYVNSVIRHYYKSDVDVGRDFELHAWAKDVAKEGLGWQSSDTKGMSDKLTTINQLVEICVILMFTSTVQHAAVNSGQFENYKFIPNSPLGMRLPPHKKGEANESRILNSLPDNVMSATAIAISYKLSSISPNEVYLGQFPERLFTEQKIIDIQHNYMSDLQALEAKIKARNSKLDHPYTFLLPSRVPNSIAI